MHEFEICDFLGYGRKSFPSFQRIIAICHPTNTEQTLELITLMHCEGLSAGTVNMTSYYIAYILRSLVYIERLLEVMERSRVMD